MKQFFRVTAWHGFSHALFKAGVPVLPSLLQSFIRVVYACQISPQVELGKGSRLGYEGLGIVIHSKVVIGRDCLISQGVTIGGTSKKTEVPILGDRVYVGAGAKILGPIKIGEGSVIGANAVVLRDVPPRTVVAGVPARVIKTDINVEDYRDF